MSSVKQTTYRRIHAVIGSGQNTVILKFSRRRAEIIIKDLQEQLDKNKSNLDGVSPIYIISSQLADIEESEIKE